MGSARTDQQQAARMIGYRTISKREFYRYGGFSNPRCVRDQRGTRWMYFYRIV
jgi:hypothetical protein